MIQNISFSSLASWNKTITFRFLFGTFPGHLVDNAVGFSEIMHIIFVDVEIPSGYFHSSMTEIQTHQQQIMGCTINRQCAIG